MEIVPPGAFYNRSTVHKQPVLEVKKRGAAQCVSNHSYYPQVEPSDHKLTDYHKWLSENQTRLGLC